MFNHVPTHWKSIRTSFLPGCATTWLKALKWNGSGSTYTWIHEMNDFQSTLWDNLAVGKKYFNNTSSSAPLLPPFDITRILRMIEIHQPESNLQTPSYLITVRACSAWKRRFLVGWKTTRQVLCSSRVCDPLGKNIFLNIDFLCITSPFVQMSKLLYPWHLYLTWPLSKWPFHCKTKTTT